MNALTLDRVADAIGDPTRSAMLIALLGGRARTAGELSMIAGVSAQSASGHLLKLLGANLVTLEVQGRHRYYRLSSTQVADALESLAALSPGSSLVQRDSPAVSEISFCRTCYDHLAGKVATEITCSLVKAQVIVENGRDFIVGATGRKFFSNLGIDVASLSSQRRILARRCLDWTERRPHISGALGAAILRRLLELKWIASVRGSRGVRLTLSGQDHLPKYFRMERSVANSLRNWTVRCR